MEYKDLKEFAEKIVREDVSHQALVSMLADAYNDSRFREILHAEIQKRGLERIERSSRKLEKLTWGLMFLTVVLTLFTAFLAYAEWGRSSVHLDPSLSKSRQDQSESIKK